ncbi:glycosyl transferase family 1 [Oscillatoriales cyanobacterium USR001]|nr:glycosyl transferase family 1 [Oscillatoriales cyanobacterium USR001]
MKILILSVTFPYPPGRSGTQVRTFNLLKYLSRRHYITLVTLRSPDVTDIEIQELGQYVQELVIFPRPEISVKGVWGKIQRFGNFLLFGTPPNVLSIYSLEMQNWVDEFVAAGKCDVITCEHSVNEIYVRSEWRERVRIVVNIHSSVYGTCKQILATGISKKPLRDRLNLPLLAIYEKRYCAKFSRIVVTTDEDRQQLAELLLPYFRGIAPAAVRALNSDGKMSTAGNAYAEGLSLQKNKIAVVPNGVDLAEFPYRQKDPGGYRLIFIGAMDYLANIDAVNFLSLEILPGLQEIYPDATLTIVGAKPTAEVLALRSRMGITVTGRVPRMAEYLHQATICVIPMRIGWGIKNKTLEAMAAGTPVVASDRALEGLAVDGDTIPLKALRANQITEYIEAISRLFADSQLRSQLSSNARSLIENEYTWEIIGKRYEQILS